MKKMVCVLLLLAPALLFAEGPFDGTWVAKLDSVKFPAKPDEYLLDKGMYSCSSCEPKINIKADGQDQKVTGSPYYNTMSVKVVDANTVEYVTKKDGKTIGTDTDTISADGNTLTSKFTDYSAANGKVVMGESTETRVEKGPAGSHATSGSWRTEKMSNFSDAALTVTYESTADGLKMKAGTGESFDAKFDGKPCAIEGDPGHTMVSLKRVDASTVEETQTRDGKVIYVLAMTVAPDGKTINVKVADKRQDTTTTYTMAKQ